MKHRETCWIRMNHGHETPWIRMKLCFTFMKHLELEWNRRKQCVSRPWNTLNQYETMCFMVMKHLESGWNSVFHCLNHLESGCSGWHSVFHGNETPWIRMKQCVSWSWNTLFHGNETPWIRSSDDIDIVTAMLITNLWPCKLHVISGKK